MSNGYANPDNDRFPCQGGATCICAVRICDNAGVWKRAPVSLRRPGPTIGALVGVALVAAGGCAGDESPKPGYVSATPTPMSARVAPSSPPIHTDTSEAKRLRERLVRSIASERPWGTEGPWSPRVLDAMRRVPRHLFVSGVGLVAAYRDAPLPIGHGQTISQPTVVALMTQALELDGDERVLEIGTGSGYQAAVLSVLVRRLFTIELVEPLGVIARRRLRDLGYDNVTMRIGDGYAGWSEHAPFDRIVLTAAPPSMPPALVAQLADGGIIVAPLGDDEQRLVRWTKKGDSIEKTVLGAVRFVPMVPGPTSQGPRDGPSPPVKGSR